MQQGFQESKRDVVQFALPEQAVLEAPRATFTPDLILEVPPTVAVSLKSSAMKTQPPERMWTSRTETGPPNPFPTGAAQRRHAA